MNDKKNLINHDKDYEEYGVTQTNMYLATSILCNRIEKGTAIERIKRSHRKQIERFNPRKNHYSY